MDKKINSTDFNSSSEFLKFLRLAYDGDTDESPTSSKFYVNIKLKNSLDNKIYKINGFSELDNEYYEKIRPGKDIGNVKVSLIPLWEIKNEAVVINEDRVINEKINQLTTQITQLNDKLNKGVKTNIQGEIGIQLNPKAPINIPLKEIEIMEIYNTSNRWWKNIPNKQIWGGLGKTYNKKTKKTKKTKKRKIKKEN